MRPPDEPAIEDPNRAIEPEMPPGDGRRPWETPRIILSELSATEAGNGNLFDGAGLLSFGS
jgi:hypothetical protein